MLVVVPGSMLQRDWHCLNCSQIPVVGRVEVPLWVSCAQRSEDVERKHDGVGVGCETCPDCAISGEDWGLGMTRDALGDSEGAACLSIGAVVHGVAGDDALPGGCRVWGKLA